MTYVPLDDFMEYARIRGSANVNVAQTSLESACAAIDQWCGRTFNEVEVADAATARVWFPTGAYCVDVADIATTTDLVVKTDTAGNGTYATTIAAADYRLEPLNGNVSGQTWPYTRIILTSTSFPYGWRIPSVQVTAKWGWPATPSPVKSAALILTDELYKRRDAAFGVAGFGEFGSIRVSNDVLRQVTGLLSPYQLTPVLVR